MLNTLVMFSCTAIVFILCKFSALLPLPRVSHIDLLFLFSFCFSVSPLLLPLFLFLLSFLFFHGLFFMHHIFSRSSLCPMKYTPRWIYCYFPPSHAFVVSLYLFTLLEPSLPFSSWLFGNSRACLSFQKNQTRFRAFGTFVHRCLSVSHSLSLSILFHSFFHINPKMAS